MSISKPFDVGNVTFDVQVPKFKTDAPTPVDLRTFAMVPVWAIVGPNLGHAAFRVPGRNVSVCEQEDADNLRGSREVGA